MPYIHKYLGKSFSRNGPFLLHEQQGSGSLSFLKNIGLQILKSKRFHNFAKNTIRKGATAGANYLVKKVDSSSVIKRKPKKINKTKNKPKKTKKGPNKNRKLSDLFTD